MAKKPYTYILSDQGTPFYVGVGIGDRMYHHEQFARGNRDLGYGLKFDYNPFKTRKIQKLIQEGRSVEYSYTEYETKEQALSVEIELIEFYGRKGIDENGILTNRSKGGTGGNMFEHMSDEQRRRAKNNMSKAVRAAYNDPVKGNEIRNKIKATKTKNGTLTPVVTDKSRAACRANAVKQRKPICQCEHDGNVIHVWESVKQASEALSLSQGSISNATRGKTKDGQPWKAGGFRWRYL